MRLAPHRADRVSRSRLTGDWTGPVSHPIQKVMVMTNRFRSLAHLATMATAVVQLAAAVGCGEDDGLGKRNPVSGTATYKAQPLTTGTVNFLPEAGGESRSASGEIQPDGTYSLTTQTPGDGAMAGKYKVAISAMEVDENSFKSKTGGSADQVAVGKASRWSLIPVNYSSTMSSGLTAEVSSSQWTFDYELTDE